MNKPERVSAATVASAQSHLHPLEPLGEAEIAAAAALVRARMKDEPIRFETIELKEPSKETVRAFSEGGDIVREARVNVYKLREIGVWRFTVSLTDDEILSEDFEPAAKPMIQAEEFLQIEETVKANEAFRAACAKRGITDVSLVCVDPWSAGDFGVPGEEGRHVAHTFCWLKSSPHDNLYAHPIEGLNPVVDIKTMEVIRVDDYGVVPVPAEDSNYEADFQDSFRDDLKPIDVVQPEGVSFAMEGRRIRWHDWDMVIGFNAREGLTLHDIKLDRRPLFYRASIAEMVVPYGSPKRQHARKNVFDIGEYGLGKLANSLTLGCDCVGAIHYLDGWISDYEGAPTRIENAICIHEEDHGILWKHWDFRTDRTEVRRARRLVISSISTVGNYEYGSYWYFHLDGEIEFEMKATGIINTVGCEPGAGSKFGTEVAPGVVGQMHQHTFCARLDLAIDGDRNTVTEVDTQALPIGPDNPYGNAFFAEETSITAEGGRKRKPEAERFWKFTSAGNSNRMGKPTAYKLAPSRSITPFNNPMGPSGARMGFIYNDLWVTAHDTEERFPAGEFVNHSAPGEGLPTWVKQQRPVEGEDIVAWHVFGLHHLPRLEDFPVQPVVRTGFTLMPSGFFDRNPTLDVAPETNKASAKAGCCGVAAK